MHVSTHLSIDMVALDQSDDVTILFELTAPENPTSMQRPGRTLMLLLDRSGSMSGEPLTGAKDAIGRLVRRLAPQDCFGLITFDDQAEVVVPPMLMKDHNLEAVQNKVAAIQSGGMTDLSAGYLLALREVKRSLAQTQHSGATILLVSDGHANGGITEPSRLREVAENALTDSITTSTLGLGLGYDEYLLQEITMGGNGNHRFAPDVDTAVSEIAQTVNDLLDVSAIATTVRITPLNQLVDSIQLRQDLPVWREPGSLIINIGDMYASEERRILLNLGVPAVADLGTTTIANVDINFTQVSDLTDHHVQLPITVNVVPGDQARNRVPNPVVSVEELILKSHDAKKKMAQSLRDHDIRSARGTLADAITSVNTARQTFKDIKIPSLTARLNEAAEELLDLNKALKTESMEFNSKLMTDSLSSGVRGRSNKKKAKPSTIDPKEQS
jgi:Ca-activated chloride channel family protein